MEAQRVENRRVYILYIFPHSLLPLLIHLLNNNKRFSPLYFSAKTTEEYPYKDQLPNTTRAPPPGVSPKGQRKDERINTISPTQSELSERQFISNQFDQFMTNDKDDSSEVSPRKKLIPVYAPNILSLPTNPNLGIYSFLDNSETNVINPDTSNESENIPPYSVENPSYMVAPCEKHLEPTPGITHDTNHDNVPHPPTPGFNDKAGQTIPCGIKYHAQKLWDAIEEMENILNNEFLI